MLTPADPFTTEINLCGPVQGLCAFSLSQALLDAENSISVTVYQALCNRLPEVWPVFLEETQHNRWMKLAAADSKSLAWNILLVTDEEIRTLNQSFRNKDQATDVLTFTLLDDADPAAGWTQLPQLELGDVYVSLPWAKRALEEAQCNNIALNDASIVHFMQDLTLYLLERIVHGCLHLLGMHHDTMSDYNQVIAIQKRVLYVQPQSL